MKIVVCIRQSADGEINPFDASAYETALQIKDADVTLLSMGPQKTASFLENLTRLGAKENISEIKSFAENIGAGLAATRKMVDKDYLPYDIQVGLTGKAVNPDVYIAFGISGAIHHIAGIRQSGTVIAVNSDKDSPIFKYADYGIVADVREVLYKKI